jgi:hypothetical protein
MIERSCVRHAVLFNDATGLQSLGYGIVSPIQTQIQTENIREKVLRKAFVSMKDEVIAERRSMPKISFTICTLH